MKTALRAALLAVTASATLTGAAGAERPMLIARPPHVRPPPVAPTGREVRARLAIDVQRLPEITLPPLLKPAEVRELAGTEPTDLKLSDPRPPRSARRSGSATLSVASARPSSIVIGERPLVGTVFASDSVSIDCDPQRPRTPIRWETLAIRADGGADWTVSDGYVDPARCEVKQVSRRQLDVPALAGLGVPAHAARVPGGVVVFTPRTEQATGDTTAGAIGVVRGPVSRVFVPTRQGESATVLLEVELGRLDAWLRGAGAAELRERPLRLTLRIDVSQTVSEPTPTLLVRSSMTMPERPVPVPAGPR